MDRLNLDKTNHTIHTKDKTMSDKNPWVIMKDAYACVTSGNIFAIYVGIFFLACGVFGFRTFFDGLQGRNCDKGFKYNDVMSYASAGGCGIRGFLEPLPRPAGYERNARP